MGPDYELVGAFGGIKTIYTMRSNLSEHPVEVSKGYAFLGDDKYFVKVVLYPAFSLYKYMIKTTKSFSYTNKFGFSGSIDREGEWIVVQGSPITVQFSEADCTLRGPLQASLRTTFDRITDVAQLRIFEETRKY